MIQVVYKKRWQLTKNQYFIIIPALFGNGQSSSPSNHDTLKNFPKVTFYDNVRAQHKLVTEELGIKHLRAVLGWSMVNYDSDGQASGLTVSQKGCRSDVPMGHTVP